MSVHTSKELNMILLQLINEQKCIFKPDNTRLQVFWSASKSLDKDQLIVQGRIQDFS